MNELQITDNQNVQDKTHTIRVLKVMLDRNLAELFTTEAKIKIFRNGRN